MAENGVKPDLKSGRWAQIGGPSWLHFLRTGLGGGKVWIETSSRFPWIKTGWYSSNVPRSNYISKEINPSRLKWPDQEFFISNWIKGSSGAAHHQMITKGTIVFCLVLIAIKVLAHLTLTYAMLRQVLRHKQRVASSAFPFIEVVPWVIALIASALTSQTGWLSFSTIAIVGSVAIVAS